MERGTLYQLRNLINRRNVTKEPKSNVNANEDFIEIVVNSYILVAAMHFLQMSSLDDVPPASHVSPDLWMEDDSVRESVLTKISSSIVDLHVDLKTEFSKPPTPCGTVCDYSNEVISLGLLYLNFKDAVKEGDGDRILIMWKYFLPIFKATGHKNYALEAMTLLTQYFVTLPPNLAAQLKWSRFINVHGLPGRNISCDLYMEHINRIIKVMIEGLGANKTEKAIVRAGRSIGTLGKTLDTFDINAGVAATSGKHPEVSMTKDLQVIVQQLMSAGIFEKSRTHKSFQKLKPNLIRRLPEKDFKDWILNNFTKYT